MKKKKKFGKLKLTTLLVVLVQLLLVGALVALYLYDVWNIQEYFTVEIIACIFVVLLVIDCLYVLISMFIYNKRNKRPEISAEHIITGDISEVYNAAKAGLVVANTDGAVLWQSEFLYQQGLDLIEKNIFQLSKKFEELAKGSVPNNKITAIFNNQTYSVTYLKNAGIFIFIDITEQTQLNNYVKEQAVCLGVIAIDNYNELARADDDKNNIISQVKTLIFRYGKKYKLSIRTLRNDSFFIVSNFKSLQAIIEDRFSILEAVKQVDDVENTRPTLTIGFSYGNPDVNKLNEMASSALEVGMSRGGDQAVVAQYGNELVFFGGKSEIQAKHNTVQIRSIGDAIINFLDKATNVYIMGHLDLDLDALGASLGVYEICRSVKKPAQIIYDPRLTERKTRAALTGHYNKDELSKMVISPKEALENLKPNTLVIVVDVNRPKSTMCPEILEKTKKVIVIDHHRRAADDIIDQTLLTYIDPSASSASEIITEIIKYSPAMNQVKIRPLAATFMLSGIFLDTGFFKSKTVGNRAFEACVVLKGFGADNILADELLKDEFEEYILINKIMATLKTPYYGVVYCVVEDNETVEKSTLAKVATQCVNLKGISAAFTVGRVGTEEIGISARSDGTVNVQLICEKLGGGGHFSSAATVFKNATIKEVEQKLLEALQTYLNEARADTKPKEVK